MLALSRSDNRKQSESDSPRFALNTVWKDGGSTNGWNALLCKSFLKPIIFDGVPRTQDHSLCWASFFESTLILPLNICLDKSTVKSIKKKNWRLLSGFDLESLDEMLTNLSTICRKKNTCQCGVLNSISCHRRSKSLSESDFKPGPQCTLLRVDAILHCESLLWT